MSTLVYDVCQEAIVMVGDPRAHRIDAADQLSFFNRAQRMVVQRLIKVLEAEALFDFVTDDKYQYPEDCLQATSVWFNPDPAADPDLYSKLGELKREEWLSYMHRITDGDPAKVYFRREFFQVFPRPAATVVDSGRIIYWRWPAKVTSISGTLMGLPDHFDQIVVDAMKVRFFEKLRMYDEARAAMQAWEASITDMSPVATDRGDDRRQNVRPGGLGIGSMDQN